MPPVGGSPVEVDVIGAAGDPALADLLDARASLDGIDDVVRLRVVTGQIDGMPASVLDRVDLVVPEDALDGIRAAVGRHPVAAATLAGLLRMTERLDIPSALLAESTAYGLLQAGAEFGAWLRDAPPAAPPPGGSHVRLEATGDAVEIVFDRPERANALDQATREHLADVLTALRDDARPITLRGEGRHFCAGGDLGEFGEVRDPALGHLSRVRASPALALSRVADRTTVLVQGASVGAGLELAAFAGTVLAAPGSTWLLPEVGMGLIPGAGGTVSIPRRIGRHRTLQLALSSTPIDLPTALAWGLVDGERP